MKTVSHRVNQLVNGICRLCCGCLVVLGLAMTVVVLLQVFFRFVVYLPFPWSEECARYLMIWMGLLGAVVAQRKGRHIGVRVFVERLPGRTYDRLVPLLQGVEIAFLAVVAREGWALALFNHSQLSPAMSLPMSVPYGAVPVGCGLMILNVISDLLHDRWPTPAGSTANLAAAVLEPTALTPVPGTPDA